MFKFMPKLSQKTIRFTVVSIFILATVITATIAISLQYHFSKNMATEAASQLFSLSSQKTQEHLQALDQRAKNITGMFAKFADLVEDNEVNDTVGPVFAEMLKNNSDFYAVYIGFGNGDFYELINLDASPEIRAQIDASFTDRWVTVAISGKNANRKRVFSYLNDDLTIRLSREENSNYNASVRPWYVNAKLGEVYKTKPYMFQHLQAPGQTYSAKIPNSDAVLAVDIALSSIDQYLTKQGLANDGHIDKEIYLFQKSGEIISTNQAKSTSNNAIKVDKLALNDAQRQLIENTGILKVSNETDWAPIDFSISGQPKGYSIEVLALISKMTGLTFEYTNGFTWPELVSGFENGNIDMLQPVFKTDDNDKRGIFSKSFVDLPFAIITQPNTPVISHINQLQGKNLAIPQGWSIIHTIKQNFPSITIIEYPSSKAVLLAISSGEVFAGLDNEVIFRYTQKQFFIDSIQYHLAADFAPANLTSSLHFMLHGSQSDLMTIINLAIDTISTKQKNRLKQKWFTASNKQKIEVKKGVVPYEALIELTNNAGLYRQLVPLVVNDAEHFIYLTPTNQSETEFLAIVVPSDTIFATSTAKVKLSIIITAICLLLILPVSWLFSSPIVKPIKLLAIENDKIKNRQYDAVKRIPTNIKEIDELATSLVDMSVAIKDHELKQQELMDSFIQLIAQTIDDKSAYTGGHCNRVPELGLMLIDEVVKDTDTFKHFSFKSDDEYREFKISAWLHDCGKIITPEHIVDKGSKLETIYNRIHEVRMRFEVLWRDAEIHYYQALITSPEQQQLLQQKLAEQQAQLSADFAFVANTNVGGEFMAEEKVERLHLIAQQTWQRNFDDNLGLSPVEELHLAQHNERQGNIAAPTLPVTEQLLTDKAEHIIPRTKQIAFDEKFAIKVSVPEHQANLGELYNLSISRGTLTTEDRYIINEHIIGTIKMLDQLPFPPELANVPKYASTHHETLIGTGYPRRLTADDLTIPERVLVIADIFEALTAADRPYKKAKPLSVAINILHKFAVDQHIDIDLFELFLTSGTYLAYAKKYMKTEQIHQVDISQYLRK
ncbi:HD domain-containing phosphohydrolase [Colwellia piezophila]|uniref:HD domain-containing phosphohydrolase n=1 Tax=Colwellia piezophila TaxID=211668 RepID=UPI00037DF628|nr:HD domain-containing phosphohydrolase [Colwellia piezophila]